MPGLHASSVKVSWGKRPSLDSLLSTSGHCGPYSTSETPRLPLSFVAPAPLSSPSPSDVARDDREAPPSPLLDRPPGALRALGPLSLQLRVLRLLLAAKPPSGPRATPAY